MRPRSPFHLFLACLVLLGAGAACGRKPVPPNILLITMDTTRSDHLSLYGYSHRTTPFLEELAASSVVFDQAYAAAPATAPSHATLFTSQSPLTHRVLKNAVTLGEQHRTFAELAVERGYQTAAIVSSFVMNAKFGLAQGFQHYDDLLAPEKASINWEQWEGQEVAGGFDRKAAEATDQAIAWLQDARELDVPFFLFVHYFDPHDPYVPPAPYRDKFVDTTIEQVGQRRMWSGYDGEIAYTDAEIRRLFAALDRLDLLSDTVVVLAGDHGEGIMSRGYQYHGAHIYEEAVRVPLLMRWEGKLEPGRRVAGTVTIADIVPTLFDLLGWPRGNLEFQGQSLAAPLLGGDPLPRDFPAYLYRSPYEPHNEFGVWVDGEKHAVRLGDWKYLLAENEGTTELYNLAADPLERANVIAAHPDVALRLQGMLAEWRAAVTRPDSPGVKPALSESDLKKLKSLGYVH
jgi:arylsulfatase A-like enzyme